MGVVEDPTPFRIALIAGDYLIEIYRNNVFMACYWNLSMGPKHTRIFVANDDRAALEYFNPVADVFRLLGDAPGRAYLDLQSTRRSSCSTRQNATCRSI